MEQPSLNELSVEELRELLTASLNVIESYADAEGYVPALGKPDWAKLADRGLLPQLDK